MAKKYVIVITIVFLFSILSFSLVSANSTNCYSLDSIYPYSKTMCWWANSSLTSSQKTYATNATANWNYAYSNCPFKFYKSGDSTRTISMTDSYNDVGKVSFTDMGWPYDATGANCIQSSNGQIQNFDIYLNTVVAWTDGYAQYYNDYTGGFTHEFGHAVGLADYYQGESANTWSGDSDVPTMWYACRAAVGRENLLYYFRDLSAGDIEGYKASIARIP